MNVWKAAGHGVPWGVLCVAVGVVMTVAYRSHRWDECRWCLRRRASSGRLLHAVTPESVAEQSAAAVVGLVFMVAAGWVTASVHVPVGLFMQAVMFAVVGVWAVGTIRHRNRFGCLVCDPDCEFDAVPESVWVGASELDGIPEQTRGPDERA